MPIRGAIPSTPRVIDKCVFADRCELAHEVCLVGTPAMNTAQSYRLYRCVLPPDVTTAHIPLAATRIGPPPSKLPSVQPILVMQGIRREYLIRSGSLRQPTKLVAVDNASLDVMPGEVMAIVGESGSGKSTLAKLLLGLEPSQGGSILFEGRPIETLSRIERARSIQAVFQDPYSSLNPRLSIGESIRRPLDIHGIGTPSERRDAVRDILGRTGLDPDLESTYPAQLSGGQRQRVAIARAVIMRPKVVVCDEPTSALDVSVQAQILNLLMEMRREFNLTYLMITHDLGS